MQACLIALFSFLFLFLLSFPFFSFPFFSSFLFFPSSFSFSFFFGTFQKGGGGPGPVGPPPGSAHAYTAHTASVKFYINMELFVFENITTIIFGVVIFLALTWLIQWYNIASRLPPGPIGWPVIGCIPQILLTDKFLHETLLGMSQKYGDVSAFVISGHPVIRQKFRSPRMTG